MIQFSITPTQGQVIKEALEFYLDGFSEDDAPNEYREANHLHQFISNKLKQPEQVTEVEARLAHYKQTAQQRKELSK